MPPVSFLVAPDLVYQLLRHCCNSFAAFMPRQGWSSCHIKTHTAGYCTSGEVVGVFQCVRVCMSDVCGA
jgi:hypothetical protein